MDPQRNGRRNYLHDPPSAVRARRESAWSWCRAQPLTHSLHPQSPVGFGQAQGRFNWHCHPWEHPRLCPDPTKPSLASSFVSTSTRQDDDPALPLKGD